MRKTHSSIEHKRVGYINMLMDELYSSLPVLYESLVDRDMDEAKATVKILSDKLKSLHDSLQDEI